MVFEGVDDDGWRDSRSLAGLHRSWSRRLALFVSRLLVRRCWDALPSCAPFVDDASFCAIERLTVAVVAEQTRAGIVRSVSFIGFIDKLQNDSRKQKPPSNIISKNLYVVA